MVNIKFYADAHRCHVRSWKIGQGFDLRITQGDPVDDSPEGMLRLGQVVKVTATDRELDLIRSNCSGIPMHTGEYVIWEEQAARLVADFLFQFAEASAAVPPKLDQPDDPMVVGMKLGAELSDYTIKIKLSDPNPSMILLTVTAPNGQHCAVFLQSTVDFATLHNQCKWAYRYLQDHPETMTKDQSLTSVCESMSGGRRC